MVRHRDSIILDLEQYAIWVEEAQHGLDRTITIDDMDVDMLKRAAELLRERR